MSIAAKLPQANTQEQGFREALEDVERVVAALKDRCPDSADLHNVVKLALDNPSQLALLFALTTEPQQGPRR
jgi:hypothetical protein